MFAELERVFLRDIGIHEEYSFTPWLSTNLHYLSEAVHMPLALERIEASLGTLRADILARDTSTNRPVLIENQLGKSNHRHLGQIVTYASLIEGVIVLWVAENFTADHITALRWLNRFGVQFYAVEIALYKIGQSEPAPRFSLLDTGHLEASTLDSEKAKTGHLDISIVDSEKAKTGHLIKFPAIPGIRPSTVERVILAHLSGIKWRDIAGNYSQTIKPIKEQWEITQTRKRARNDRSLRAD